MQHPDNRPKPATDHEGTRFPSIRAMAKHWGISQQTYQRRRDSGMTIEQALTACTDHPVYDHLGTRYGSIGEMAAAWHISRAALAARLAKGVPVKQALTEPVKGTDGLYADHTGKKFRTMKDMAEAWGQDPKAVARRLAQGWDTEKALTQPARTNMSYEGPDGETFTSKAAFAKHYGISWQTATDIIDGKDTLDAVLGRRKHAGHSLCRDHLGNEYPSESAMLKAYGTNWPCYRQRQEQGWDLGRNLTTRPFIATDPGGREFTSTAALARAHGLSPSMLQRRLTAEVPLARALDPTHRSHASCQDHTGRKFRSVSEMTRHWGHNDTTLYLSRIERGWSVEAALTKPPEKISIKDHLGNEYPDVGSMCAAWNTTESAYKGRRHRGMTLEQALTWDPGMTDPDPEGNRFRHMTQMARYWFCAEASCVRRLADRAPIEDWSWPTGLTPFDGLRVSAHYGSYALIEYAGHEYMMTREALHTLLCRLALEKAGAAGATDPKAQWLNYVMTETGRGSSLRRRRENRKE